jgi:hypothetical protein
MALTAQHLPSMVWNTEHSQSKNYGIEGSKKRKVHNRKQNTFTSRTIAELRHGEHCT